MKLDEAKDRLIFLQEMAGDEAVVLDPEELDDAIIGVSSNGELVYSLGNLVVAFEKLNSWTTEEAQEWIGHNVMNTSYDGLAPVFIWETPVCKHERKFYQPAEADTNTPESLSCDDCGIELDLPEYDPDNDREFEEFGDWIDMEKS